jgi:hypothetical protein
MLDDLSKMQDTKSKMQRQHWTWQRLLSTIFLLVTALLLWAFAPTPGHPAVQAAMFACALACAVTALRPHYGLALVILGIMALVFDKADLEAPSAWNITFLLLSSVGMGHLFRRWKLLAWVGASLPVWAMSHAIPFLMYFALGLVFAGMALTGVRPLLSRKRRTGVAPLPQLKNGPLADIPPRIFGFHRGTKAIGVLTVVCGFACLAGCILLLAGRRDAGAALALSCGILGLSFGFCLWFNTRMYFRIDSQGIHSRVIWGEKTIPWDQLGALSLRYVYFPGFGLRYVYYCVLSPVREITFPDSMTGAGELCGLIEKASGLKWPGATKDLP